MPQRNMLESAASKPPYDAVLAAIRHATHVCAFYETEEDLLDLVSQFCAAGARRGDLCLWMMPEGAKADALAEAGVELHSADDAYLQGDRSKPDPWWPSGTKNSLKPSLTITPACAPAATHAGCSRGIGRPLWRMRII